MQEFSDSSRELIKKYINHCAKMMEGKDIETRALMAEAFADAVQILARFENLPQHELIASVYVFCRDEQYQFISKRFEACIETAILAPDEFVHGLHKWCNAMAAKLKNTPGGLKAFAEFASLYRRLSTEKAGIEKIDQHVVWAYIDLICLMLNYIRPNKFDSAKAICGVTTDGKPLTIHNPYALDAMPSFEFKAISCGVKGYKDIPLNVKDFSLGYVFRKYGFYNVETSQDANLLNMQMRYFQDLRLALLPYINEYTYDIMPEHMFTCILKNFHLLTVDGLDVKALREKLRTSRRRTLPSNGITVTFDDPTVCLKALRLKEMVINDEVIMLYKLSFDTEGDICGYYNTNMDYIYSPNETMNTRATQFIDALIFYFYAVAVLDDEAYCDAKTQDYFQNFIYPIKASSFGRGGKLLKTYPPLMGTADAEGPRHNTEKYEAKDKAINGYIRKLPKGQSASEEARAKAKKMGYDLKSDETYVSPFFRTTFYLKQDEPSDTKDNNAPETK